MLFYYLNTKTYLKMYKIYFNFKYTYYNKHTVIKKNNLSDEITINYNTTGKPSKFNILV